MTQDLESALRSSIELNDRMNGLSSHERTHPHGAPGDPAPSSRETEGESAHGVRHEPETGGEDPLVKSDSAVSGHPAIVHSAEEQWLMARAERVTATDAADIICHALEDESGLRAPAEILAAKLGLAQDVEENEPMRWGHRLQRVIAEVYSEETGRSVEHVEEFTLWNHPSIPWLSASGDAIHSGRNPLEVKTDGVRWFGGVAPMRHQIQNLIQQSCLAIDAGAVTAFVDRFRPLVSQDIPFNERFFASCLPLLEEFYGYLQRREVPTDAAWHTKASVRAFWPKSNGESVALDHDALRIVNRWDRLKQFRAWAEEQKDAAEVSLAVAMGDAGVGLLPDGSSYRIRRSSVAEQSCECGRTIRAAHVRVTPVRDWPKHLKPAPKALTKKGTE